MLLPDLSGPTVSFYTPTSGPISSVPVLVYAFFSEAVLPINSSDIEMEGGVVTLRHVNITSESR